MNKFILIATMVFAFPAMAQKMQQLPPQAQQQSPMKCMPIYQLPVDMELLYLMTDNDGDKWYRATIRNTGVTSIGYVKRDPSTPQFCFLPVEGKVNPQT